MASISVGTRNLKFMQRGTQLPAAPATPGRSSAPAQPSEAGGRSKAGPVPQQQEVQEQQEEEEEWVLPSRRHLSSTRLSSDTSSSRKLTGSGTQNTHIRQGPRVVRQDSSYLSFIGGTSGPVTSQPTDSSGDSSSSESGTGKTGERPSNGRMTFGSLPTAQRLDTSIVDSREEMKHLKAQETSSTRFQVFADSPGATKGRAGNGNVNGGKGKAELGSEGGDREPRDSSRRARKTRVKEEDDPSTPTATAQRFLKPSLGDDRRQGGSPLGSKTMKKGKTVDGTPLSSSTSRRKKRKSGEREDEGDEQVLMAGARGKRGKTASTKKKSTAAAMTADKDPDMEDLAGRAAAGGDADVERYLRSVIHEMED